MNLLSRFPLTLQISLLKQTRPRVDVLPYLENQLLTYQSQTHYMYIIIIIIIYYIYTIIIMLNVLYAGCIVYCIHSIMYYAMLWPEFGPIVPPWITSVTGHVWRWQVFQNSVPNPRTLGISVTCSLSHDLHEKVFSVISLFSPIHWILGTSKYG